MDAVAEARHIATERQLRALDADIERGIRDLESGAHRSNVTAFSPTSRVHYRWDDGSKFAGGFGPTSLLRADYWTLRARSAELFETNLYARGLIRRLVTNEINTGLHLEATPEEELLGYEEEELTEWTETTENRFALWAEASRLCDHKEERTFGALQFAARAESLISGDVLVVLRQDPRTKLPRVQLIGGESVLTPFGAKPRSGNRIKHGVELDSNDRQVAYWVRQRDGSSKRLPARGEKSGRRLAWLVYGTERRLDHVRGKPILALVLQSLKEIDRYRDSTQRKAVLTSMLAMFIQKNQPTMGSKAMSGGAVRRGAIATSDESEERSLQTAEYIPGLILDELAYGEEPKVFQTNGTVESFGTFEAALIQAIAWANNVPPEILTLAFSNNYSASQAAINEFKIYLNLVRTAFGKEFCHPIYIEWLVSEALAERINAPRLVEAWRDLALFDVFESWVSADWSGHIKPSTDILKQAKGYKMLVEEGFSTRDRASRELTGTKYSKNVKKLRRENEALAEAMASSVAPRPHRPARRPRSPS